MSLSTGREREYYSLPAGVVLSIATDQPISDARMSKLTNHIDVVTRDTDRHVDDTMYPDSFRLWQLKRLDPGVVQYREQRGEQNDVREPSEPTHQLAIMGYHELAHPKSICISARSSDPSLTFISTTYTAKQHAEVRANISPSMG